jgi:hypothetical protein
MTGTPFLDRRVTDDILFGANNRKGGRSLFAVAGRLKDRRLLRYRLSANPRTDQYRKLLLNPIAERRQSQIQLTPTRERAKVTAAEEGPHGG